MWFIKADFFFILKFSLIYALLATVTLYDISANLNIHLSNNIG